MAKITEGSMAYLIESELERASLVLAAKDITDRLQKMAEDLAKVEADDIMPILDQLREVFGQDAAEQFNTVATAKVRLTIEALKDAKQGIGTEIDRLEKGVSTGVVPNDMELDSEEEPEMAAEPEMADDLEEPKDDADDLASVEDAEGVVPDLDFEANPESTGPALGRVRKESALPKGGRKLAESKNPEALILSTFRKKLGEGQRPIAAARDTAKKYDVDVQEVSRIVSEAFQKKNVKETIDPARKAELQRKGYTVGKDNKGKHFWVRPEQKTGGPKKGPEVQAGNSNNEMDAWADLDAYDKTANTK